MKFEDLGLAEPLLRSVKGNGYSIATEIQAAAIPAVLEGQDVLGCAQTGTGKTAAFALPTLHRLAQKPCRVNGRGRKIRTLVLAPTRELAIQIHASFATYGRHTPIRQTVVFGGVNQSRQVGDLNRGMDIVVATPGRLLDLIQQGYVDLAHVETLILDEADRMLDMGFLPDLKRIIARVPTERQTLLFSATLPRSIRDLAGQWLNKPIEVRIASQAPTVDKIQQSVLFVAQNKKRDLLTEWLQGNRWTRTLVFTRTKHGADQVVRTLAKAGIAADAFHGNKSQNARQRVLKRFKSSRPPVLVATDIAARGLDVENVSHVVNFDLPDEVDNYVHRIGRTGRAGADGVAVSFCSRQEHSTLRAIEAATNQKLLVGPRSEAFSEDEPAESARPAMKPRRRPGPSAGRHKPAANSMPKRKWRPKAGSRAK
jgi:ATP-dependent RNA helicase RhlE